MNTESCYLCGIVFAVPESFQRNRLKDKGEFHCPCGHKQSYIKSTAETLAEEKKALEASLLAARARRDENGQRADRAERNARRWRTIAKKAAERRKGKS